jgi:hypothetical protein
MKFSNMGDFAGKPHFVCKTGRKHIRILEPGQPYERSFVVPLTKVSNRRPADFCESDEDAGGLPESIDDLEFAP